MYTIVIDNEDEFRHEWRRVEDAIGDGTVRGVVLGVKEGAVEALRTRRWKDRTGATARATRGVVEVTAHGAAAGYIECAVPHATYLADGQKPHEIWPKAGHQFVGPLMPNQRRRAKSDIGTHRVALRWYSAGGQVHFATKVNHPGTHPDAFMANGRMKCQLAIVREVELGVVRAQGILDS